MCAVRPFGVDSLREAASFFFLKKRGTKRHTRAAGVLWAWTFRFPRTVLGADSKGRCKTSRVVL